MTGIVSSNFHFGFRKQFSHYGLNKVQIGNIDWIGIFLRILGLNVTLKLHFL